MNRQQWLVVIGVLVLGGVGVYHLMLGGLPLPRGNERPALAQRQVMSPQQPQPVAEQSAPQVNVKTRIVEEETPWGRNPFLTEEEAVQKKVTGSELTVKTIIAGRRKSVATIDGHTLVVGDRLGEETVVEIRPDAVVLESEGRRRILRIREPSVLIEVKENRR